MMRFLVELLERAPTTAVTTVLSFFIYVGLQSFWSRWLLRRMRNQAEKYAREHGGQREHALVVSVLTDIQQDARGFLASLKKQAMPVSTVHRKEGLSAQPADWLGALDDVKKKLREIREVGVDRIHLFINMPIPIAVMLGAVLANGPEVILYHFTAGHYSFVGRIAPEVTRL